MPRSTAAKLLLILAALLAGLASAFQLSRYPAKLRCNLGGRQYSHARFSPDSKTLLTVEQEQDAAATLRLWDVATGYERATVVTELSHIEEVEFSPNSLLLAVQDKKGVVQLRNTASLKQQALVRERDLAPYRTIRFSADSTLLAVQADFRSVQVLATRTGSRLAEFESRLPALAFSPDGRLVAHGAWNSDTDVFTVRVWDVKTKEERAQIGCRHFPAYALTFVADGTMLACAWPTDKIETEVELLDVSTWQRRAMFTIADEWKAIVTDLFSPNRKTLVAVSYGGATVWDIGVQRPRQVLRAEAIPSFPRNATLMAIVDYGGAELWDLAIPQKLARFDFSNSSPAQSGFAERSGQFSSDGKLLALVGVQAGGLDANEVVQWLEQRVGVRHQSGIEFSTQLWDVGTQTRIASFNGEGSFSPDSRTLLTRSQEGKLALWDLAHPRPLGYILGLCLSALLLLLVLSSWCLGIFWKRWYFPKGHRALIHPVKR